MNIDWRGRAGHRFIIEQVDTALSISLPCSFCLDIQSIFVQNIRTMLAMQRQLLKMRKNCALLGDA